MYSRKASAAVIAHAETERGAAQDKEKTGLVEQRADYFINHLVNLRSAVRQGTLPASTLAPEALEIAQWANLSFTAAALQQMALRFAGSGGALASLVRERQDLAAGWHDRDNALIAALSKPEGQRDTAAIEAIRKQTAESESRLRPCSERPRRRTAEKANELTSPHIRTQSRGPALYRLKRAL